MEKLQEIKTEAVRKAEKTSDVPENLKDVIDQYEELMAFYQTAYQELSTYIDETKDPHLIEKKKELEKISQSSKENTDKDEWKANFIKKADQYWEDLVFILEKDEIEKLEHGNDLFKKSGLSEEVKLISYTKTAEGNVYAIEKDYFQYEVKFAPNGKIYLKIYIWQDQNLNIHQGQNWRWHSGTMQEQREISLSKQISLSELKDLSAFNLYMASPESAIPVIFNQIESLFSGLPNRSTDPELKAYIELRNEVEALRQESFRFDKLNETQAENIVEKLGAILKMRLRQCFDMFKEGKTKKRNSLAEKIRETLLNYPHFIDFALSEVKTLSELNNYNIFYLDGNHPFLSAKIKKRHDELLQTETYKEFEKIPGFNKLSNRHKETFAYLKSYGVNLPKDLSSYIKALGNLSLEILIKYKFFVTDNSFKDEDGIKLLSLTVYANGLNQNQFIFYCNYAKENLSFINDYNLKKVNLILRKYKDFKDLKIAAMLAFKVENKDIDKYIPRIKKLEKKFKEAFWEIEKSIKDYYYKLDLVLVIFEKLDKDIAFNYSEEFLSRYIKGSEFTDDLASKINALKPFQLEGLIFIYESSKIEKINEFFTALLDIKNEEEMNFVLQRMRLYWKTYRPNCDVFIKTCKLAKKYSKLFETPGKKLDIEGNSVIDTMETKGIPEETIIASLENIFEIKNELQSKIINTYITPENAKSLIKIVADKKEETEKIANYSSSINSINRLIEQSPPLEIILRIISKLSAMLKDNKSLESQFRLADIMTNKTGNYNDFFVITNRLENPEFIRRIKELAKKEYTNIPFYRISSLISLYFAMAVSLEDLNNPEIVLTGLESFLKKSDEANYESKTDPDLNRAASFLDIDKFLTKKDTNFTHIAFILNILQNSSEKYSKERLIEISKKLLQESDPILQEKGAKLLIGLGTYVQSLDSETVKKIALCGVDDKLTKKTVSDKITTEQLEYINKTDSPRIPLSLYFSFLVNLEEQGKSKDQKTFEELVEQYKIIENQPVYKGQVLILSHDTEDSAYSYVSEKDPFSPEAHQILAGEIQGLKVNILRNKEEKESVESMLSMLEETDGDLTLVIGGHGTENFISFQKDSTNFFKIKGGFTMEMLFERLKKRLQRQKDQKWETMVIFDSCHSSYNIEKLMDMWGKDENTKDNPVKMLSSASENLPSAKMTNDSWIIKAKESKKTNQVLTWKELYRDIESKNFIMSGKLKGIRLNFNSNITLYINGKKLG